MPRLMRASLTAVAALAAAATAALAVASAAASGGDPQHGRQVIVHAGCGACHQIPGVDGADGEIGPSLKGLAQRKAIAGVLPNTPSNLVRWIRNPQSILPRTAMPNLELNDHDARDVAAYLYSVR